MQGKTHSVPSDNKHSPTPVFCIPVWATPSYATVVVGKELFRGRDDEN